jgi:hypothetical protein
MNIRYPSKPDFPILSGLACLVRFKNRFSGL